VLNPPRTDSDVLKELLTPEPTTSEVPQAAIDQIEGDNVLAAVGAQDRAVASFKSALQILSAGQFELAEFVAGLEKLIAKQKIVRNDTEAEENLDNKHPFYEARQVEIQDEVTNYSFEAPDLFVGKEGEYLVEPLMISLDEAVTALGAAEKEKALTAQDKVIALLESVYGTAAEALEEQEEGNPFWAYSPEVPEEYWKLPDDGDDEDELLEDPDFPDIFEGITSAELMIQPDSTAKGAQEDVTTAMAANRFIGLEEPEDSEPPDYITDTGPPSVGNDKAPDAPGGKGEDSGLYAAAAPGISSPSGGLLRGHREMKPMRMNKRTILAVCIAFCTVSLIAIPTGAQEAGQSTSVARLSGEVKQSITRGLDFFAQTQNADGSWGDGNVTGGTALALMSFMLQGHVPGEGKYGEATAKAIDFLISVEKNGYFHHDKDRGMYEHGLALLAFSEAWGQSKDLRIREVLKRGVNITLNAQNHEGGWRYTPRPSTADTSCSAMQVVALASAREAGIAVPAKTIQRAVDYITACEVRSTGGFTYQLAAGAPLGGANLARTACSSLALMLSGQHKHPATRGGVAYIAAQSDLAFDNVGHYFYAHYYAVQVMYQAGDEHFNKWYPKISTALMKKQNEDGSWGPHNRPSAVDTGFAILTLGVPYRYLPIYQK